MALNTNTVKISEVKTALGSSSNSLITLCKSASKWSAHKPFSSGADSYTYSDFSNAIKNIDYALLPNECSTAEAALTLAQGNQDLIWPYERPAGTVNSKCRLGDFRGYNHSAPAPYYSNAYVTQTGLIGHWGPEFQFAVNKNNGAEILAENMPTLSGGSWVILWRKLNASTANVSQGSSVSSATFPQSVDVASSTAGTFEACAAIYKNSSGYFYPVPNTYQQIELTIEQSVERYLKITVTIECFVKETRAGSGKWVVYTRVTVKNDDTTTITPDYYFNIQETVSGTPFNYSGGGNNLTSGNSVTFLPGDSTEYANIGGLGYKNWGVIDPFEAGTDSVNFTYSAGVNKFHLQTDLYATYSGSPADGDI